ncbi:LysM peptidoglycan-binding domain-containing protein [Thiobacter aerophilum]|uniref:LysM peptidoglycan-binding domain-containing protein n=1 Tax=Thiobacter aerophilum TaxID=3121275 RepID=A0ABV0EDC9_9BURK
MRKVIITLVAIAGFLSVGARAQDAQVKDGAPERYVVVKGDTLWGIAGRFLDEPWRWPEIWQMNRDQIKNPHRIYPGDVVVLERLADGKARLRLVKKQKYDGREKVTLTPSVRIEPHPDTPAIPVISPADIGPFLSQPLVVAKDGLADAPEIVAAEENRVVIGAGNRAYATGIKSGDPQQWQVFRPGRPLVDPDTQEVLGYEAVYLGEARVKRFGEPATIEIVRAVAEINRGDRLVRVAEAELSNFVPHAPDRAVRGRIVSVYSGVAEAGPKAIVALNRGSRDGLARGQVLAIYRHGMTVPVPQDQGEQTRPLRNWHQTECLKKDAKISFDEFYDRAQAWGPCPPEDAQKRTVTLPEERYGLLLVFRTFDRVAYALVMQAAAAVHQGDVVTNP